MLSAHGLEIFLLSQLFAVGNDLFLHKVPEGGDPLGLTQFLGIGKENRDIATNTTSREQQTLKIRQPIKASFRMRRSRAGSSLRPGRASHAAHDENIRDYGTFDFDNGYCIRWHMYSRSVRYPLLASDF